MASAFPGRARAGDPLFRIIELLLGPLSLSNTNSLYSEAASREGRSEQCAITLITLHSNFKFAQLLAVICWGYSDEILCCNV